MNVYSKVILILQKYITKLNLEKRVKKEEYGKFYKEHLARKTALSQIKENGEYTIGINKLSGKKLKEALFKTQENYLNKESYSYNITVGFSPKINAIIVKEKNISYLKDGLLEFTYKNDLPIVLTGEA